MHPTRLVACAALLALCAALDALEAPADDEYWEVVRAYAGGHCDEAVARLSPRSDTAVKHVLDELREELKAAAQCPGCPRTGHPTLLRAAVMLHADADELERRIPTGVAVGHLYFTEERGPCPGRDAWIAGQYARLLADLPESREFARRFFLFMAQRSQQRDCSDDAVRWAQDGLRRFPKDAGLSFTLGSVIEQNATQREVLPKSEINSLPEGARGRALADLRARDLGYEQARSSFRAALAADPGRANASLHLGRVLWRLRASAQARAALESAVAQADAPETRYLAHLFLGRVHEDDGRLDAALVQYRLAFGLEPSAQSAGFALSSVAQQVGDKAAALQALSETVAQAGRRSKSDPYWGYAWGEALGVETLGEGLRAEAQVE